MNLKEADLKRVRAVLARHEAELLSLPNVIGVGVGMRQVGDQSTGEAAIVVLVRRKLAPESLPEGGLAPSELEGVPVDVQEIGEISAQN